VKGGDFQWVQFPAVDESFQLIAIGAEEEATNPLKHFGVKDCLGQFGEQTGRNASERRAVLVQAVLTTDEAGRRIARKGCEYKADR